MCNLPAGNQSSALASVKTLSQTTSIRIIYLNKNVDEEEDNFLFNRKVVVVSGAAIARIKRRLLSTTLILQTSPFKLISENARTLPGKRFYLKLRSVCFFVSTAMRRFITPTSPLRPPKVLSLLL
jgi:hypothetical protein